MMGDFRVLAVCSTAAFLLVALGACGKESLTKPGLIDPTKTGDAFDGVQCKSIRPPTEPDLMGWDAGSRAKLKSLHEEGVVAVRYKAEGCNVELELLNCVGEEQYSFSAYSASETKTAKSQQELYAKMPIGAAELGGKVGGGQALRTDYVLAGMKKLGVMDSYPASKLKGRCDRATHVVSTLYIGGFAMAAGESETIGARASVFGVGGELSSDRSADRLVEEGNRAACQRAQAEGKEVPLCSVPLRVGLTPIEGRAEGGCPAGSSWNGKACVQKEVLTEVSCPAGTTLRDGRCVGAVDEGCPSGMRFEAGRGCVANVSTTCPSGTRFVQGQGCVAQVASVPPPKPAAAPLLCDRFKLLDAGDDGKMESKQVLITSAGLVSDTRTGLTWTRFYARWRPVQAEARAFCQAAGMRLPTKDEAIAIAGAPGSRGDAKRCPQAWPNFWWTWTSSPTGVSGQAWLVDSNGMTYKYRVDGHSNANGAIGAICVR